MTPAHDPVAEAREILRHHRPPRLWWLRLRRPLCIRCGQWCTWRRPCTIARGSRHIIATYEPPPNIGSWEPPRVARGVAQVPINSARPQRAARHREPFNEQPTVPWNTRAVHRHLDEHPPRRG